MKHDSSTRWGKTLAAIRDRWSVGERTVFTGLLIWGMVITILRTLRAPNDWAKGHWLLSYRFGFIKRGLPGTVMHALGLYGPAHDPEYMILAVSVILLVVFLFLNYRILHQFIVSSDWKLSSVLMVLCLATSPYYVFLAHLNGYFDIIIGIITIVTLLLVQKDKWWGAALLQIVAMLVHETYLLVGFPVVVLYVIYKWRQGELNITRWLPTLAIPIVIFVLLGLYQETVDLLAVRDEMIDYLIQSGIVGNLREFFVPIAYTTSFNEYLSEQLPEFPSSLFGHEYWRIYMPVIIVGLLYLFKYFRIKFFSAIGLLIIIIIGLPLVMHMIAWDTERIWSYPIFHLILISWVISQSHAHHETHLTVEMLVLFTIIILLNITAEPVLMDHATERFTEFQRWLLLGPMAVVIYSLPSTAKVLGGKHKYMLGVLLSIAFSAFTLLLLGYLLITDSGALWIRIILAAYCLGFALFGRNLYSRGEIDIKSWWHEGRREFRDVLGKGK
jgi:hypothetical protein